jgi:hypothetical protein
MKGAQPSITRLQDDNVSKMIGIMYGSKQRTLRHSRQDPHQMTVGPTAFN